MRTIVTEDGTVISELLSLSEMLQQEAWDIERAVHDYADGERWRLKTSPKRARNRLTAVINKLDTLIPDDD